MSMSYEERKNFAKKTGTKAKGYWLTQSRYLEQVGDDGPIYTAAAPGIPVKVLLPDGEMVTRTWKDKDGREQSKTVPSIKEDAFLKAIVDENEPPKKPSDSHLPGKKPESTKKASEKFSEKSGL